MKFIFEYKNYFLQPMNDKKITLKTRFEERQELERSRQNQKNKNQQAANYKSFGVYDFLFFFIVIIVSVLCKVLGVNF